MMHPFYPRFLRSRLVEGLTDSPVVLIHGPRQCGKTTLAQEVGEQRGYVYRSFDDDVQRSAAKTDPVGYVADLPERAILDEVQRVPELFTSLKRAVDIDRRPGRFILTGSANVLLLPRLADSLAGRIELLRLHPLSQAELAGRKSDFLRDLFSCKFSAGERGERMAGSLADRVAAGGFPAALARALPRRRQIWYRDYAETLVQRDIRDLARVHALEALPRLLEVAAGQTARLMNITDLSADFELSRPTIRDYTTLLSRLFLLEELPAWSSNRLSRLVKSPKLHIGDTGLACGLLRLDSEALWKDRSLYGQILETFVYQELRRMSSWSEDPIGFFHYRDKDGNEVDVVLEAAGKIAGVEVKGGATVTRKDFTGLRTLRDTCGKKFAAGVVLYDGGSILGFGEKLYAVPISALWGFTSPG